MIPKPERHENLPTIAHQLLNKLSIIIGNCDLLIERVEGTEHTQRLGLIRDIAKTAVDDLVNFQHKPKAKMARTKVAKEAKTKCRIDAVERGNEAHNSIS